MLFGNLSRLFVTLTSSSVVRCAFSLDGTSLPVPPSRLPGTRPVWQSAWQPSDAYLPRALLRPPCKHSYCRCFPFLCRSFLLCAGGQPTRTVAPVMESVADLKTLADKCNPPSASGIRSVSASSTEEPRSAGSATRRSSTGAWRWRRSWASSCSPTGSTSRGTSPTASPTPTSPPRAARRRSGTPCRPAPCRSSASSASSSCSRRRRTC